jgi:hypothetical protein
MKIAKDEAAREEIDVKIGAYDSALNTLKAEGNTEEEWEQIRDGGADFSSLATKDSSGNVIKSGFENFLAMTYEE